MTPGEYVLDPPPPGGFNRKNMSIVFDSLDPANKVLSLHGRWHSGIIHDNYSAVYVVLELLYFGNVGEDTFPQRNKKIFRDLHTHSVHAYPESNPHRPHKRYTRKYAANTVELFRETLLWLETIYEIGLHNSDGTHYSRLTLFDSLHAIRHSPFTLSINPDALSVTRELL